MLCTSCLRGVVEGDLNVEAGRVMLSLRDGKKNEKKRAIKTAWPFFFFEECK